MLRFVARALLFLLGWRPLSKVEQDQLWNWTAVVAIYPHTSYWDFAIVVLYYTAYPDLFAYWRTLVKPQVFENLWSYEAPLIGRWISADRGFMPATRREDRHGGAVTRIVSTLKGTNFVLMISPKGTIERKEWRTGYWQIARQTGAQIRVVGLDYARRSPYIGRENIKGESEEDTRKTAHDIMRKIIPRNSDKSEIDIPHVPDDTLPCDMLRLTTLITGACAMLLAPNWPLLLFTPLCIYASFRYHDAREKSEFWEVWDVFSSCLIIVLIAIYALVHLVQLSLLWFLAVGLSFVLWYDGCCAWEAERTWRYLVSHAFFHLSLIAVVGLLP